MKESVIKQARVGLFGAGFPNSQALLSLVPNTQMMLQLCPYMEYLLIIDREKIERENYETGIYLKNKIRHSKASVLAQTVNLFSSIPVTVHEQNIQNADELFSIVSKFKLDLLIIGTDNIESRLLPFSDHFKEISVLSIGITENYILIDWYPFVALPQTDKEIEEVKAEHQRIEDTCSRIEMRPLGSIAAAYLHLSFVAWLNTGLKIGYEIKITDDFDVYIRKINRGE